MQLDFPPDINLTGGAKGRYKVFKERKFSRKVFDYSSRCDCELKNAVFFSCLLFDKNYNREYRGIEST